MIQNIASVINTRMSTVRDWGAYMIGMMHMNLALLAGMYPTSMNGRALNNMYGGIRKAGKELRPEGSSNFEAEFGGMADTNNKFYSAGHLANYWDSESHHVSETSGGVVSIHYKLDDITHSAVSNKNRNSVRCVRNYEGYDK